MSPLIERLEAELARGRDDLLLRFGLGNALLGESRAAEAALHLERALAIDASHTASWKLLGRARAALGDATGARSAFRRGIEVAESRGDLQAAREMRVFMNRLPPEG